MTRTTATTPRAGNLHASVAGQTVRPKDVLGRAGEKFAADFYRARGSHVLAANVHYRVGEIDLVVREPDGTIVFVEVKTRASRTYGVAEAVTKRKVQRLRKAAAQWLDGKPFAETRFDVLGLVKSGSGFDVEYFQGVEHGSR